MLGRRAQSGNLSGHTRRHPRSFTWLVIALLLVSAGLLTLAVVQRDTDSLSPSGVVDEEVLATIAVLDVAQALSVVVVTADGASLVYDFGLTRADAEETIIPFLHDRGINSIDHAILSHPHQDHVGGLPALLEQMPVNHYIDPVLETTNQSYLRSLELLADLGTAVSVARRGNRYQLGEFATFEILWPVDNLLTDSDGSHLLNDNSTVVRLDVDEVSVLLTGDIESAAEHALANDLAGELRVDILQVAHHGSNTSSQDEFLQVSRPEVGIIPVGTDNRYGHPHREVIQRLRRHDITIYRTDIDGTVIVRTDGRGYSIMTSQTNQSWINRQLSRRSITLRRTSMATRLACSCSTMVSN